MTHVGTPPADEINGNLIVLNALAGIPLTSIMGFRAPYLNYSGETLKLLAAAEFTYDSSSASSIPVTTNGTDAYWPYTLDNGMANDCLAVDDICKGQPVLPGFWEIPMYSFFDELGAAGVHLMDPWLWVSHLQKCIYALSAILTFGTAILPMVLLPSTTRQPLLTCRIRSLRITPTCVNPLDYTPIPSIFPCALHHIRLFSYANTLFCRRPIPESIRPTLPSR